MKCLAQNWVYAKYERFLYQPFATLDLPSLSFHRRSAQVHLQAKGAAYGYYRNYQ